MHVGINLEQYGETETRSAGILVLFKQRRKLLAIVGKADFESLAITYSNSGLIVLTQCWALLH